MNNQEKNERYNNDTAINNINTETEVGNITTDDQEVQFNAFVEDDFAKEEVQNENNHSTLEATKYQQAYNPYGGNNEYFNQHNSYSKITSEPTALNNDVYGSQNTNDGYQPIGEETKAQGTYTTSNEYQASYSTSQQSNGGGDGNNKSKPPFKKNKSIFKITVVGFLALSLTMNFYLLYRDMTTSDNAIVEQSSSSQVETIDYDINTDVTKVVDDVNHSVVGVAVYSGGQPLSTGSGVIYNVIGNESYIITNNHVVEDGTEIQVVFSNQESVKAELLGSDQYSDIAVLRVTTDFETEAIDIGDSDLVKTGEPVLAIGSPLGIEYAGTVTSGIVSATNRTVSVDLTNDGQDDWDLSVIQTDAAINPGNSGGAFVNAAGELIGITTLKFSDTSVEGMGFALPINDVMDVANEIVETGKVSRPIIGISGISLSGFSGYELSYYQIDTSLRDGIYVSQLTRGGAAEVAGVQEGDIIVSLDGAEITTYKSFLTELYSRNPGDKVELGINRQGEELTINVTLGG